MKSQGIDETKSRKERIEEINRINIKYLLLISKNQNIFEMILFESYIFIVSKNSGNKDTGIIWTEWIKILKQKNLY